jgi:hypothetical protein
MRRGAAAKKQRIPMPKRMRQKSSAADRLPSRLPALQSRLNPTDKYVAEVTPKVR